jgi:hypothetical protein
MSAPTRPTSSNNATATGVSSHHQTTGYVPASTLPIKSYLRDLRDQSQRQEASIIRTNKRLKTELVETRLDIAMETMPDRFGFSDKDQSITVLQKTFFRPSRDGEEVFSLQEGSHWKLSEDRQSFKFVDGPAGGYRFSNCYSLGCELQPRKLFTSSRYLSRKTVDEIFGVYLIDPETVDSGPGQSKGEDGEASDDELLPKD